MAIKRLLVLQLIALGVKPIDLGRALNLVKNAVSDLLTVRKLSIRNRAGAPDNP